MRHSRSRLSLVEELCFGVCILALSYWVVIAPGFFSRISWGLDDAGMFLRYARNISDGFGVTWNRGDPPTYGITSPLYMIWILLALHLPFLSPPLVLTGSSWFFGGVSLVLIALLIRWYSSLPIRSARDLAKPLPITALVISWLSLHPLMRHIALNGMESTLALSASSGLALGVTWFLQSPSPTRALCGAMLGYLAFSARPELGLYGLAAPLIAALVARTFDAALRPRRRALLTWFAAFVGFVCVDGVLKWIYFGNPLPLSFYVKQSGIGSTLLRSTTWEGVVFLPDFLLIACPFLIVLLATVSRRSVRGVLAWLMPVGLHCLYLDSVSQVMGYHGRLYLPAIPFIVCAMLHALALTEIPPLKNWFCRSVMIRLAALIAFGLVLMRPAVHLESLRGPHSASTVGANTAGEWSVAVNQMLRVLRAIPPGASVALTEHGFLGAEFPNLRLIDLTGLHNPTLAHPRADVVSNQPESAQHLNANAPRDAAARLEEVLSLEKPDFIWFPPPDYVGLRAALAASPFVREHYVVLRNVLKWGVAVRKGSHSHATFMEALGSPIPAAVDTLAVREPTTQTVE